MRYIEITKFGEVRISQVAADADGSRRGPENHMSALSTSG